MKRNLTFFLIIVLLTGCSTGPLKLTYKPGQIPESSKVSKPLIILLKPYVDSRGDIDPHYIGDIKATVYDVYSNKLTIEKGVAASVTDAVRAHLTTAGFTVKESGFEQGAHDNGDIIMSGEITKFRFDIGGRDEIEIEIVSQLKSGKTGRVIWGGVISEKDDRYAGVFGNSRKTITSYISKTLAKVINKTIAEMKTNIEKAERTTPSALPIDEPSIPEGMGRIFVRTEPPRAKVYIGDIYYGLSPLTIDIEQGIYDFVIKLGGFKDTRERVAIRRGHKIDMEITMEKE
jgi:uncharacterized lipoprotein YajG